MSRDVISAADRVEILILVDNTTDNLSSVPHEVVNEWPRLWKRGMRELSGKCICCGAHGLSCAVTAWRGDASHTLLFDTGPEASVFEQNVERLGFDMGTVDGIVLSHGHWDHGGAMLRALEMIRASNGGRAVPTICTPTCTEAARSRRKMEPCFPWKTFRLFAMLEEHGARVVHSTEAQRILDNLFFISGEIPRVTEFETGLPGHHRRTADGTDWEPDPLLMDERFVAVHVRIKVSSC
jgi:7,8-dihydropterin-6-yl-methyl-4-(beta-D-ribofuranosyl)aminobenzene 5'-phosphate synthase